MPAISVELGGVVYASKVAATEAIRSVYKRCEGEVIVPGHDDWLFLLSLFLRHPDAYVKSNGTVSSFVVKIGLGGSLGCYVNHFTDFSYKKCLGSKPSVLNDLSAAMRKAVVAQVVDFRDSNFIELMNCELCGQPISRDDLHIDHVKPFREIRDSFLNADHYPVPVVFDRSGEGVVFLSDDWQFSRAWCLFHLGEAVLRCVHSACNLSRR